MTIYDVLERMIIGPPFRADEEQAAVELIHEMRDMNIFGSIAAIDRPTHECDHVPMFMGGSRAYVTRCRICGEEPE